MQFNESIIIQSTSVALRAWDEVEEQVKWSVLFTKTMQSPREIFNVRYKQGNIRSRYKRYQLKL